MFFIFVREPNIAILQAYKFKHLGRRICMFIPHEGLLAILRDGKLPVVFYDLH